MREQAARSATCPCALPGGEPRAPRLDPRQRRGRRPRSQRLPQEGVLAGGGLIAGSAFFSQYLGTAEAAISKRRSKRNDVATDKAKFAATAQVLEDTGVKAYFGQVANVFQPGVLTAAGTIATVEARHAAWIRFINGATPAPATFDRPNSEQAIRTAVGDTGFIKS